MPRRDTPGYDPPAASLSQVAESVMVRKIVAEWLKGRKKKK
jgi:hypothetical protein